MNAHFKEKDYESDIAKIWNIQHNYVFPYSKICLRKILYLNIYFRNLHLNFKLYICVDYLSQKQNNSKLCFERWMNWWISNCFIQGGVQETYKRFKSKYSINPFSIFLMVDSKLLSPPPPLLLSCTCRPGVYWPE